MRWSRILMVLGLASTAVAVGAGCSNVPTTVGREVLEPPLGLSSAPGNGAVTLRWRAGNLGEGREGFDVYQANGTQASTPGEAIPAAFGATAVATLTTSEGVGSFNITIADLANGTTYSFLVVAYKDGGGSLSPPSNVVSDTPQRESAALIPTRARATAPE